MFDDGPSFEREPIMYDIISILKELNIGAIFALTGKHADEHSSLLKKIVSQGHHIINHSWEHKDFSKMTNENALNNIDKTQQVFTKIIGEHAPIIQFPYLKSTKNIRDYLENQGYSLVDSTYRLGVGDYNFKTVTDLEKHIDDLTLAPNQNIIGLHNIKVTKDCLKYLIRHFTDKGYNFHEPHDNIEPSILNGSKYENYIESLSDKRYNYKGKGWNYIWIGLGFICCILLVGIIWFTVYKKKNSN